MVEIVEICDLSRKMMDREDKGLLEFRGAMTDGGVQEGMIVYWVDNMFARAPTLTYCSEVLERDVRCVGLYCPTATQRNYSIKPLEGKHGRAVLYDEGILKV